MQVKFVYTCIVLCVVSSGVWACLPDTKSCTQDSVCSQGLICKNNTCIPGCRKTSDCPPKHLCVQEQCTQQECSLGSQKTCYEGSKSSRDIGLCRSGSAFCLEGGRWSACLLQRTPQEEICDRADNDCDGQVDEGLSCSCKPGEKRVCYHGDTNQVGVGNCRAGVQHCGTDFTWDVCIKQILPQKEVCDGFDNDCNGKIDDTVECPCTPNTKRSCYSGPKETQGKGLCKAGTQTCTAQRIWGPCTQEVTPQPTEICNNQKDDDCDGQIDNDCGCKQACSAGQHCLEGLCVDNEPSPSDAKEAVTPDVQDAGEPTAPDRQEPRPEQPPESSKACSLKNLKGHPCNWVLHPPMNQDSTGYALYVSKGGDILIAGTFTKTLTLGQKTIHKKPQSTGSKEPKSTAYVAKINAQKQVVWLKALHATASSTLNASPQVHIRHIVELPSGGFFVAGQFLGVLRVNSTTQITSQQKAEQANTRNYLDGFIIHYNDQGTAQWGAKIGGEGEDGILSMQIDEKALYIFGYTTSSKIAQFGIPKPTDSGVRLFYAKWMYTPSSLLGNPQWLKYTDSIKQLQPQEQYNSAIHLDPLNKSLYITWNLKKVGFVKIDNKALSNEQFQNDHSVVAALNTQNGQVKWHQISKKTYVYAIVSRSKAFPPHDTRIWLTGSAPTGSIFVKNKFSRETRAGHQLFVAPIHVETKQKKRTAAFQEPFVLHDKNGGSTVHSRGQSLSLDPLGRLVVTGSYTGRHKPKASNTLYREGGFVTYFSLNPLKSLHTVVVQRKNTTTLKLNQIHAGHAKEIYVVGDFEGQATFAGKSAMSLQTQTSPGWGVLLLWKLPQVIE